MPRPEPKKSNSFHALAAALILASLWGCATPATHLREIDNAALSHIEKAEIALHGEKRGYSLDRPSDLLRRRLFDEQRLPLSHQAIRDGAAATSVYFQDETSLKTAEEPPSSPQSPPLERVTLRLLDALEVGAKNSREYQNAKEEVFLAALEMEDETHAFRHTFSGLLETMINSDLGGGDTVTGSAQKASAGMAKRFEAGAELTARLAFDLVALLSGDRVSSLGIVGDASITIPLLRGAGRDIAREPLTQAEKNLLHALHRFEHFKRAFAVQAAKEYLNVLRAQDEVENTAANASNLDEAAKRASRLAEAGRLPAKQVGQAQQNVFRARERLLLATHSQESLLDAFKIRMGLPPDARILLDRAELAALNETIPEETLEPDSEEGGDFSPSPLYCGDSGEAKTLAVGSLKLSCGEILETALANRRDLLVSLGTVEDKKRRVKVTADSLRGDLTLGADASMGEARAIDSADLENAKLRPERGRYGATLSFSPPFDRVPEAIEYRKAVLDLEKAVRDLQQREDAIKLEVLESARTLVESARRIGIQKEALGLAERRVDGALLLLEAGRAEMRDLLDAREDFLDAQNSLMEAKVRYRIAELELRRDMGILTVDDRGLILSPALKEP